MSIHAQLGWIIGIDYQKSLYCVSLLLLTLVTSDLGIWLNLNMVLYLEDLANPKIGLNLAPNH
jgi:hypothetical protein